MNLNQEKLVSIILPVYNAEKYIESTIHDIFSQTYKNFELIISYDEKSTDNTLIIIDKLQKKYPIIVDIGMDSSLGAARNRGLKNAKGEFIVTLDVDDVILPEYLESMMNVFQKHPYLDVVCCGVLSTKDTAIAKGKIYAEKSSDKIVIYDRHQALLLKVFDILRWGTWAHMVRKSYIEKNDIKSPDYTAREDFIYTLKLFMNTPKIGYSEKIVYLYLKHTGSITATKFDKWYDMCQESRNDLKELSKSLPNDVSDEIKFRDERLVAAGCACKYKYKTYLAELDKHGVSRLSFYRGGDSMLGKISVIIFNISKYAYYRGMRHMKKCN